MKRNIEAVLGYNPLLWCWPRPPLGSGLKYDLTENEGVSQHFLTLTHSDSPLAGEPCPLELETSSPCQDLQSASPWTYQDEGFNPALQPSSAARRQASSVASKRRSCIPEGDDSSHVPPYHPEYDQGNENALDDDDDDDESSDDGSSYGRAHVRRGSEGYEVRSINRENLLQRYLEDLGEKPGRYVRYISQPDDHDENDDDDASGFVPVHSATQPTQTQSNSF